MDTSTQETLTELVEQAACCVNMLSPGDLSDAEQLQHVLDRIQGTVGRIESQAGSLEGQLTETATQAGQMLHHILEEHADDTAESLKSVGRMIADLQELIRKEQLVTAPEPTAGQSAQTDTESIDKTATPDTTTTSSQATVISPEDAPLVLDFVTEADEHIETAESALLELENQPNDNELINKIFRAFHTIKGMAGFLNLTDIGSLAHSAENLLDRARKGQLVLAGDNSDAVFASVDLLKKMLADLKRALESGTAPTVQPQLSSLLELLKAASEGKTSSAPVAQTQQADPQSDQILEETLNVQKSKASTGATGHTTEDKIKVSTSRLDNLVNMTGELVIAQLMVAEEVNGTNCSVHELARKVAHQEKIVRELQELSMSMRMVPVQGVFQKMTRLARDLSRKANKPIDFITTGEETELDRTVVDKIADPLIHMVRNSIDHGIESVDRRLQAGKPGTGGLELGAKYEGNEIWISVTDDGVGLDREKILMKARERGLLKSESEGMKDEEVWQLIFEPGFSTAEAVTNLSGRGVGMDVVRKNIEALRGTVNLDSQAGVGTTVSIRLPLTLAIIDGFLVGVGQSSYVIPLDMVMECLEMPAGTGNFGERGYIPLRGAALPVLRLRRRFEADGEPPRRESVVVVQCAGQKAGLVVDELKGEFQTVIKPLGRLFSHLKVISGSTILGTGEVALIVDVPSLIDRAMQAEADARAQAAIH